MAKAKVVAGDYKDYNVVTFGNKLYFMMFTKRVEITSADVFKYEIIDDIKKSFWGTLVSGAAWGALFGTPGLIASTMSSARKRRFLLSIEFNNGKKSLVEVSDNEYKNIIKVLY